ncbi:MAG: hypothetical protein KDD69_16300 [Bdellovibrionales bacterium]|nr:hypothetical protein [Bdellovibrionales bacterium]
MITALTNADLYQFTGDDLRYQHPLKGQVIYTPGIRHLAEAGNAYWLIDAIASYFGSPEMSRAMERDPRLRHMQFWKLTITNGSAVLVAEADADVAPFITQQIPFTDFPLPEVSIWAGFDGSHWTLYLPSEH